MKKLLLVMLSVMAVSYIRADDLTEPNRHLCMRIDHMEKTAMSPYGCKSCFVKSDGVTIRCEGCTHAQPAMEVKKNADDNIFCIIRSKEGGDYHTAGLGTGTVAGGITRHDGKKTGYFRLFLEFSGNNPQENRDKYYATAKFAVTK